MPPALPCTCLSHRALLRIATDINRHTPGAIVGVRGLAPCALLRRIEDHYGERDPTLWPAYAGAEGRSAYRPKKDPLHGYQLTTVDIIRLLRQYERAYPDFTSLGAVPMDFCKVAYGREVCNLRFRQMLSAGKDRIAIVFNTDPHHRAGRHWIMLWIDIRPSQQPLIAYFDSEGMAPPKMSQSS